MSSNRIVTVANFSRLKGELGSLVAAWEMDDKAKQKRKKSLSLAAEVNHYDNGHAFNMRWKQLVSIMTKIFGFALAVAVILWLFDWELLFASLVGSSLATAVLVGCFLEIVMTYGNSPPMIMAKMHLKRFDDGFQALAKHFGGPNALLAMSDKDREDAAGELIVKSLRRFLRFQPHGHPTPESDAQWKKAEILRAYFASWYLAGDSLTPYFQTAKERGPEEAAVAPPALTVVTTPPDLPGEGETAAA